MNDISIYDWRVKRAEKALLSVGIPAEALVVLDHNPSRDLPYHNNEHALSVVINTYEGAVRHGLPGRIIANLLAAALFHDYSHVLDTDDAVNIERAIAVWRRNAARFADYGVEAAEVEYLIASTKFPHDDNERIDVRIIRDADILQTTEPDAHRWLDALSAEKDGEFTINSSIEFLSSHLSTEWGIEKAQRWINTMYH